MKGNGAPTTMVMSEEDVRKQMISSSRLPLYYFNQARVVSSYYDFKVFFGTGSVTPQGQQTFVEEMCIAMTPEFARVVATTLLSTLEGYERAFGTLRPIPQRAQTPEPARRRGSKKQTKQTS